MRPRLAFGFLFVTVLLDFISFGIIMPVLPQLLMDITGDPVTEAARYGGWLLVAYAGFQFFSAPLLGNLSDRFGRRPVLLLSLLAMSVDYLMMAWAPTLIWLFVGRIIAGISASTYGIANAFVADVFDAEERPRYFALLGAAFGAGFVFGPMIGGLLGELGPRAPFYAVAGLASLNVIYGFLALPESLKPENRRVLDWRRANPFGAFRQIWRYPVVFGLMGAYFLYLMGHHSLPSVFSFYMIERFDWSSSDIGWSFAAVGICIVLVQAWLIRPCLDAFGPARTAILGLLLTIASFVGYAVAPAGWMIYLFIPLGACQGLIAPSVQGLMTARVPANAQGELQGAVVSVGSLVSILSPPFMTHTFNWFSAADAPVYFPGAPFLAAAGLTLCSLFALSRTLGPRLARPA